MTSRFARHSATISGAVALALALSVTPARGQSGLEQALRQYSSTSIEGYLQPLADVLVANLSLGYINSAPPKGKFSFGIELVAMTAKLDDALRLYEAATPAGFDPPSFTTPTIFGGSAEAYEVNHAAPLGALSYRGTDGLIDAEYMPAAAPQLRLGGILGTDLVFRYASSAMLPMLDKDNFDEASLLGIGIQHSLNRYFKSLPLQVSVGGSYNALKFGDYIDFSSTSFGLNVGKSFGILGLSAGVASEGGSMKLAYAAADPQDPDVNVDLEVARAIRFRVGGAFNLGPLKLFGDAAFGDVTSYSGGLRIGF